VIDAEELDVVGFGRVRGPIPDQATDETESFDVDAFLDEEDSARSYSGDP
jgi:hypothetical protein